MNFSSFFFFVVFVLVVNKHVDVQRTYIKSRTQFWIHRQEDLRLILKYGNQKAWKSFSGFVNNNHFKKWNRLMQIWRENDDLDIGCPLLGKSACICVQLYSHLCSIQKAEEFKSEVIPHRSYFDLLLIDLLLYWWVPMAKVKIALVCAPCGAADLRRSLGTAPSPVPPRSAVPRDCLLFKCRMGALHPLPSLTLQEKFCFCLLE